jgi:metallophosphoesterase (TIGR00282 family)
MQDKGPNILMLGDIVGEPGLDVLERRLTGLIQQYEVGFVTANGENSSIMGMTEADAKRILACGVDVITSGNHVWEKRDFWSYMDGEERILRPANYPPPAAGRGFIFIEKQGFNFWVINLQGREYMTPIDCPFRAFDQIFSGVQAADKSTGGRPPCLIVDFHAESTREKEALGFYVDGRASVFACTHTHIQTADEKILPMGTAYISDLGMTGVLTGIIGMDKELCMERARKQIAYPLRSAQGAAGIQGICVRFTEKSVGMRAASIERFSVV